MMCGIQVCSSLVELALTCPTRLAWRRWDACGLVRETERDMIKQHYLFNFKFTLRLLIGISLIERVAFVGTRLTDLHRGSAVRGGRARHFIPRPQNW
jgi:hypothetical protein